MIMQSLSLCLFLLALSTVVVESIASPKPELKVGLDAISDRRLHLLRKEDIVGLGASAAGLAASSAERLVHSDDDWVEEVLSGRNVAIRNFMSAAVEAPLATSIIEAVSQTQGLSETSLLNHTRLAAVDSTRQSGKLSLDGIRNAFGASNGSLQLTTDYESEDYRRRFTTWDCLEAHGSQYKPEVQGKRMTCKFRNLYYDNTNGAGAFVAHVLKGQPDTDVLNMLTAGASSEQGEFHEPIRLQEHSTLQDFIRHVSTWTRVDEYDGLSLAFHPVWHFNVGHALFDGLYPAFVSLMQHGDQDKPFRPLVISYRESAIEREVPGNYRHSEEIFGQIGGIKSLQKNDLDSGPASRHCFKEVIFGVGTNSAKIDVNVNYTLGACRSLDACRAFRKRVLQSLGLGVPKQARQNGPFRVKVILNRRDTNQYRDLVNALVKETKHGLSDFSIEQVDWSPTKQKSANQAQSSFDSVQNGDFKRHMEIIQATDIHISGPGTAQMYQTFLPDGAVHINMGSSTGRMFGFMEEYMAEGSSYFSALYYPWRAEHAPLFTLPVMVDLLREARALLEQGPQRRVPVNANLSPLGKVYKAYAYWLHKSAMSQRDLARLIPLQREFHSHDWFGNNFLEDFVYPGKKCSFDCSGRDEQILKTLMLSFDAHHQQRRGQGWFTQYLSNTFAEGISQLDDFSMGDSDTGSSSVANWTAHELV